MANEVYFSGLSGNARVAAILNQAVIQKLTDTASLVNHPSILQLRAMNGSGFTFGPDVLVRAQGLAFVAASGLAATPAPGCTLTIGTAPWQIIGTDTLSPAGTAVLHALALVRG